MDSYTREINRTLSTSASPLIDVSAIDGSIRLRGEERNDVYLHLSARIRAESAQEADEMLARIERGIAMRDNVLKIETPREHAGGHHFFRGLRDVLSALNDNAHIDFELVAPRGARADLKVVNGEASAEGVLGDVNVQTINGAIRLANVGGNVGVRTVNGRISIERCDGGVSVNQKNGDVEVRRVRGHLALRILNGNLRIVEPGSAVDARALSGEMSYRGAVRDDVTLNSSHGSIQCYVPRDARFSLDAMSHLGSVSSELPVNESGGGGRGQHAPHVSLRSQTGSIALRVLEPASAAP